MNKRGFRRLTLILSIWAGLLTFALSDYVSWDEALGSLLVPFGAVWIVYFSPCYVAKGFRRGDK